MLSYLFVLQFHLLFLFFKLEQHHKVLVVMCSMGGSDSNADFVAYLNALSPKFDWSIASVHSSED